MEGLPFHELWTLRSRHAAGGHLLISLAASLLPEPPCGRSAVGSPVLPACPGPCAAVAEATFRLLWWDASRRHPWSSWEAEQRDQLVVPLKKSADACSPGASVASLSTTDALRSSLSRTGPCRSTAGRRGGLLSAMPCCTVWPLRKGSRGPAGVTSDATVWSSDCGWSLARRQLCVAFAVYGGDGEGVAASEVMARCSASLHLPKHGYWTTKSE